MQPNLIFNLTKQLSSAVQEKAIILLKNTNKKSYQIYQLIKQYPE